MTGDWLANPIRQPTTTAQSCGLAEYFHKGREPF